MLQIDVKTWLLSDDDAIGCCTPALKDSGALPTDVGSMNSSDESDNPLTLDAMSVTAEGWEAMWEASDSDSVQRAGASELDRDSLGSQPSHATLEVPGEGSECAGM
jgi:hypothetical protein